MGRSGSALRPAKYSVVAAADGAVSRGHQKLGYGASPWLPVRGWATERAYLRFELPTALEVRSARLRLCVLATRKASIDVFLTSNGWTERSLAFGAAPRVGRLVGRIALHADGPRCNVAKLSSAAFSGRQAVSFVVVTNDHRRLYLAAREKPRLRPLLTLVAQAAPVPSTTAVGVTVVPPTPTTTSPPVAVAPPAAAPSPPAPKTTTTTTTSTPSTTTRPGTTTTPVTTTTQSGGTVVVAAAGDVACDPADGSFNGGRGTATACHEARTAAIVESIDPAAVLGLGDMQYEDGELSKFTVSYDKTWGAFRSITYTTSGGGHDGFATEDSGYCQYFGSHACPGGKTYYSIDVGAWHIISLDGNCTHVGGCQAGSAEEQWLRADLAAHHNRCTIAMWHYPRWTIGEFGDDPRTDAFVRDLYAAGAELILVGHDHLYARFAPQTPDGGAAAEGIREFVVGTGGKNHLPGQYPVNTSHSNLQAWSDDTFGILELTLHPTSYDWAFVPDVGSPGSFTDSGSAVCH
jgi:acid phosphatase type 7